MSRKASYDYYLILATAAVLFVLSVICIYAMFWFRAAEVHLLEPVLKARYMDGMNRMVAPFVILLILLLGICVPKRLLPVSWLNGFAIFLLAGAGLTTFTISGQAALLLVLVASLVLQLVVLALAVVGSQKLSFTGKGYWIRVGSSLVHLGLILFILDLFLYHHLTLHLLLFWVTTVSSVAGMLCCFYADSIAALFGAKQRETGREDHDADNDRPPEQV